MDEACKHTEKSSQETKTKSPGDKLKNETSAREAVIFGDKRRKKKV